MKKEQEQRARELFLSLTRPSSLDPPLFPGRDQLWQAAFTPAIDSSDRSSRSFPLPLPSSCGTRIGVGALPLALVLLPMSLPSCGVR